MKIQKYLCDNFLVAAVTTGMITQIVCIFAADLWFHAFTARVLHVSYDKYT